MMPPTWMIEELNERRREREERERPQLRIEVPEVPRSRPEPGEAPREPIVIELWG